MASQLADAFKCSNIFTKKLPATQYTDTHFVVKQPSLMSR